MSTSPVLVVLAGGDGGTGRLELATIALAQQVASRLGRSLEAIVLGAGSADTARALADIELDRLRICEQPALTPYTPGAWRRTVAELARAAGEAPILIAPHRYRWQELLPGLAVELDAAMVAEARDLVAVEDDDSTTVEWLRPAWQGKLRMRLRTRGACVVSAAPEGEAPPRRGRAPAPESWQPTTDPRPDREVLERISTVGEVDLGAAEILVAVGRGIGDPSRLEPIRQLARRLGGSLAASRPVVDAGWLPREHQVGTSGQTVSPRLYLALGISGALQHLQGMSGAECVVAVNTDPSAPMLRLADLSLVADLHEVVAALLRQLGDEEATR